MGTCSARSREERCVVMSVLVFRQEAGSLWITAFDGPESRAALTSEEAQWLRNPPAGACHSLQHKANPPYPTGVCCGGNAKDKPPMCREMSDSYPHAWHQGVLMPPGGHGTSIAGTFLPGRSGLSSFPAKPCVWRESGVTPGAAASCLCRADTGEAGGGGDTWGDPTPGEAGALKGGG